MSVANEPIDLHGMPVSGMTGGIGHEGLWPLEGSSGGCVRGREARSGPVAHLRDTHKDISCAYQTHGADGSPKANDAQRRELAAHHRTV